MALQSLNRGAFGQVIQVITITDNTKYVFSSGTSNQFTYYDIATLQATITPTSSTSKILLLAQISCGQAGNAFNAFFRYNRNGTAIGIGDPTGVYSASGGAGAALRTVHDAELGSVSMNYLDSPATTSPVTYKIQICNSGGSTYYSYVNRPAQVDTVWSQPGNSTFTLMEIAQ